MTTLLLLAQNPEPLSGGAGWVGAGLLGLVLAWLLFWHLPAKDKQINDVFGHLDKVVEKKDVQIDVQRKEFTESLAAMVAAFKSEANAERAACEKHFGTLAESMNGAFRTLGEQLRTHSERNQQWLELLRSQVEEAKRNAPPVPNQR